MSIERHPRGSSVLTGPHFSEPMRVQPETAVVRSCRGPGFLRLANWPSALYPRESEEKCLSDAMLLAVQR